jgi:hypothetical protein
LQKTEAHRGRGRGARRAERDGVGKTSAVEPHQAARHRGRRQTRDRDAVPGGIALHQLLAAAENLVAEHHRGDDFAPARAGELAGRERHRNVVAGMAAEVAALEDAHERAVGEHSWARWSAARGR